MISYPNIDPVIFSLGPLDIRWYGLAYVLGILGAWGACSWCARQKFTAVTQEHLNDFVPYATLGVVLGGRLGHVLFYELSYYLAHPLEVLMIWQPGMSFHGGLLGVILASIIFTYHRKIKFLALMDAVSVGVPIGLFFGRIANFINGELWGRITDLPWGMVFPGAGPLPRHPSQLYEAFLEGVLLLVLQFSALRYQAHWAARSQVPRHGFAAGCFSLGYGIVRFCVEYVRDPSDGYIFGVTAGQALSLPMVLLGAWLMIRARLSGSPR